MEIGAEIAGSGMNKLGIEEYDAVVYIADNIHDIKSGRIEKAVLEYCSMVCVRDFHGFRMPGTIESCPSLWRGVRR